MVTYTENTRFGPRTIKVNKDDLTSGIVSFQPEGQPWFTLETVGKIVKNRQVGRFVGAEIQTTAGTQTVFTHNCRQYAAIDPIVAFSKLAWSELA